MQKITHLALLAAAFVGASAHAEVYVEGNYYMGKLSGDHGYTSDPKVTSLRGIVGYGLHPNLAVEGALGYGLGSTTVDGDTLKQKLSYGFYVKPRYQVTNELEVFARLGYLKDGGETSNSTGSDKFTNGTTAWGLGANYAVTKNVYLSSSYGQTYKKDGMKINGLSLGVGYRF